MPKTASPPASPSFSRKVRVEDVPPSGVVQRFAASAGECASVARALELPAVHEINVEAQLARRGREGLSVKGVVKARVNQICVVSLEPFEALIEEPFSVDFAPEAEALAAHERAWEEIKASPDKARTLAEQPDPPDPIIDGKVDLGALALEYLVIGLDPHPRKPGVSFDANGAGDVQAEAEKASPFARLQGIVKDERAK